MLVDANILLYAHDTASPRHHAALGWLEEVLNGTEPVRFAWVSLLAFLRISTTPRVFEEPLTISEAAPIVSEWLTRPMSGVLDPGERHWGILGELLQRTGVRGAEVTDAHLAAIALEHGATLYTADAGFARFPGLRAVNPLEPPD
jgi:toxin-antitoxin system PIN domain toxin